MLNSTFLASFIYDVRVHQCTNPHFCSTHRASQGCSDFGLQFESHSFEQSFIPNAVVIRSQEPSTPFLFGFACQEQGQES
jgi:hypothetical protein